MQRDQKMKPNARIKPRLEGYAVIKRRLTASARNMPANARLGINFTVRPRRQRETGQLELAAV